MAETNHVKEWKSHAFALLGAHRTTVRYILWWFSKYPSENVNSLTSSETGWVCGKIGVSVHADHATYFCVNGTCQNIQKHAWCFSGLPENRGAVVCTHPLLTDGIPRAWDVSNAFSTSCTLYRIVRAAPTSHMWLFVASCVQFFLTSGVRWGIVPKYFR